MARLEFRIGVGFIRVGRIFVRKPHVFVAA